MLFRSDAEFQKKCMGKMDEVSHRQGRTILFVSHNMGAISQLCNRVVCLDRGRVALDTPDVSAGVREYLNVSRDTSATAELNLPDFAEFSQILADALKRSPRE